jgi:hypothetical protein
MEQRGERVEIIVDPATARWLQACARVRGVSMAEAAARQLREDALADAVAKQAAWLASNPTFFEDAEAERIAAAEA